MAVVGGPRTEAESERLYREACAVIPGGVSSPVRAMRSVGRDHPLFAARGEGAWLIDADGNRYVDWVLSWGPLIAGHAHPRIVEAVSGAAANGTSFGAPTELEVELARQVVEAVPSVDMVRFVSSGTEATMSAVRLARAFTGRSKVLKFAGCYHGHVDALLAQAGSGLATLAIPSTPGVPAVVTADTLIGPFNDLDAARALADANADDLACVIVEPVAGNMGVVPPAPGFLEGLRAICNGSGALLIADEVITGFRVGYGGAQERLAFRPDLTCLGKILGGGLPAAAFGGRGDVMERLAPLGDVYQAGTLSGNPLAMAAGLATLELLREEGAYERLERTSAAVGDGLGAPGVTVNRVGAMLTAFFSDAAVTDFASASAADSERYARFHAHMLSRGVYLAPSQFEAMMPSLAHTDEQVELTVAAAREFEG
jgi:glutamate-1-semialdehyde 2,1-aminomutase